jgi:hypothetical protein
MVTILFVKLLRTRISARVPFLRGLFRPSLFPPRNIWISADHRDLQKDFSQEAQSLADLFRRFGSDKSSNHSYQYPYAFVLSSLPQGGVIEVGLGSVNVNVESNMSWYRNAQPGGSLRVWREIGKFQNIVGADVDADALFSEPGISTFWLDQLDVSSLKIFAEKCESLNPDGYSLVIDDGLHTAEANVNTFESLWPLVKVGGYFVIEDISPSDLHSILRHLAAYLNTFEWGIWQGSLGGDNSALLTIRRV